MTNTITMKQNDTAPAWQIALVETDVTSPSGYRSVDLTLAIGATLKARSLGLRANFSFFSILEITSDAEGQMVFTPDQTMTAEPGTYRAEVEVEWPQGFEKFPRDTYFTIIIVKEIEVP